jgi:hypothetical protein
MLNRGRFCALCGTRDARNRQTAGVRANRNEQETDSDYSTSDCSTLTYCVLRVIPRDTCRAIPIVICSRFGRLGIRVFGRVRKQTDADRLQREFRDMFVSCYLM